LFVAKPTSLGIIAHSFLFFLRMTMPGTIFSRDPSFHKGFGGFGGLPETANPQSNGGVMMPYYTQSEEVF
jgi:hypothetical protein